MSVQEEDEKMKRARVLLKQFQTKQSRRSSINESDDAMLGVNVFLDNSLQAEGSGERLSQSGVDHSQSPSCRKEEEDGTSQQCSRGSTPIFTTKAEITRAMNHVGMRLQSPQIDKCHSLTKIENLEKNDIVSLQAALAHKEQEFKELQTKHREMHSHYVDLHSAYGILVDGQQKSGLEQVQQLRMALSVALEEKMSLQNELRELKLHLQKFTEKEKEQNSPNAYTGKCDLTSHHEMEAQLIHVVAERDHLINTVANQSTQIEHQRRECSSLEAKVVLMQQDRIDAQGRIKSLYALKAQLEQTIEQQRSELTMRDIYIRQLTRQSDNMALCGQPDEANEQQNGGQSDHVRDASDTQENQGIRQKPDDDLEWHKNKMIELQKQLQLVHEQCQTEKAHSNANTKKFIEQLDTMRATNIQLETCNNLLEERLRILQQKQSTDGNALNAAEMSPSIDNSAKNECPNSADGPINLFAAEMEHLSEKDQLDQLMHAVKQLTTENDIVTNKLRETEQLVQEKEHDLEQLHQSLAEAQCRVAHLEQLQNIQSIINTDVSLLSDQLQNEKATVSRAVAQNVELKCQLKELQDRLIVVINESAAKEDERLTALATIERLTHQRNVMEQENDRQIITVAKEEDKGHQMNGDDHLSIDDDALSALNQTTASPATNNSRFLCDVGLQTDTENVRVEQIVFSTVESRVEEQQQQNQSHKSQIPKERAAAAEAEEAIEEVDTNLAMQMEALNRENALYRSTNERLEHWLTALESENESIGDYIALYRFQRTQIQQRITEKDAALQQLQQQNTQLTAILSELRNAILAIMHKNVVNNDNGANNTKGLPAEEKWASNDNSAIKVEGTVEDINNADASAQKEQHHYPQLIRDNISTGQLMRVLKRSEVISRQATCIAAHQAQIHCTGCVECQGELFNL